MLLLRPRIISATFFVARTMMMATHQSFFVTASTGAAAIDDREDGGIVNIDCTTSQGDQDAGVIAFYDPTCKVSGVSHKGCHKENTCRFCQAFLTSQSEHYDICPTSYLCQTSDGDQKVGVFAYFDTSCDKRDIGDGEHGDGGHPDYGYVGCFDNVCRHCALFDTPQSEHLIECPFAEPPTPTASPVDHPSSICDTVQGDKDVGVFGYYDESCIDGDHPEGRLGCFNDNICRHCKAFNTDRSQHLVECPEYVPHKPAFDTLCITTSGDRNVGKYAIYDLTCLDGTNADGVGFLGCYNDVCRLCKKFITEQSKHLIDCPVVEPSAASSDEY